MALATDGSDYGDYDRGSATYVSQLRVWIKTLRKAILKGEFSIEGRSWSPAEIGRTLERAEKELDTYGGSGTFFRGVPLR